VQYTAKDTTECGYKLVQSLSISDIVNDIA